MAADVAEDAFASVIIPGIHIALEIFHFASPLGSAGDDMKGMGAEVTLFCAIMRQVRVIFTKPKTFRISTTAYQDVHDVLEKGGEVFEKIRALLTKLQDGDDYQSNVFMRVGQTFKKTRVLMWKESLRACTATAQVMLTTMAFAERMASTESVFSRLLTVTSLPNLQAIDSRITGRRRATA